MLLLHIMKDCQHNGEIDKLRFTIFRINLHIFMWNRYTNTKVFIILILLKINKVTNVLSVCIVVFQWENEQITFLSTYFWFRLQTDKENKTVFTWSIVQSNKVTPRETEVYNC